MREYTAQKWYNGLLQANEEAESKFYDLTLSQIMTLCHREDINEIEADQIFIDSYVLCLANIRNGKYKFVGNKPSSYAYSIAHNKIKEYKRKRGLAFVEHKEDSEMIDNDWEHDFIDYGEKSGLFWSAFNALCTACKGLLNASYEKKLKDQQIADSDEFPAYNTRGGVNRRKRECSEEFKANLEKNGYF